MVAFPLLAVSFILTFVAILFVVCCLMLILVILIQKGRGGGLSAAFGGGGAGGILGSKTGDFLTWVTIVLVGVFLVLAVVMAKFYRPTFSDFGGGPPTRQRQPVDTGQSSGADDAAVTVGDVNSAGDANSSGG